MKRLWSIISIFITLVLLALVIQQVGAQELTTELTQADPAWLLISFIVGQIIVCFGPVKHRILLRSQGHSLPLFYLIRLYWVGTFFNNFLPTNVGGDVVRAYEVSRRIDNLAVGTASVFVERLTGLMMLVLFASVGFVFKAQQIDNPLLTIILGLAIFGLLGITWLVLDARLMHLVERLLPFEFLRKLLGRFRKFQNAMLDYRQQRGALFQALVWSFIFYWGAILYCYVSARAFYPDVPFFQVAIIMPITMVVAMMPFSFNGIGLQEWAFVVLFPLAGIPASVGLSTMFLIRAYTLFTAILGGIVYIPMRARPTAV